MIEEPTSPQICDKGKAAVKAKAEIVEVDDSVQGEPIVEQELPKKKIGRGKSVQFDIIEEEHTSEPVTPIQEDIPTKPPQKAVAATKEEADVIERNKDDDASKTPVEEEIPKKKLQRGLSASIEEADVIKSKLEPETPVEGDVVDKTPQKGIAATKEDKETVETKEEPKLPVEAEIPKKKPQKGKTAVKEEAEVIEVSDLDKASKKPTEKTIDRQDSKKGVRSVDDEEDDEVEALLKRAQKQRSLIEEIKTKESEAPEGTFKNYYAFYERDITHCTYIANCTKLTSIFFSTQRANSQQFYFLKFWILCTIFLDIFTFCSY